MRYQVSSWPQVVAFGPDTDDRELLRAYRYVIGNIADVVGDSRDGRLRIEVIAGPNWLRTKVDAEPKLARRERQVVWRVVQCHSRQFPQLRPRATKAKPDHGLRVSELEPPLAVGHPVPAADLPGGVSVFDEALVSATLIALKDAPTDSDTRGRLRATLNRIHALGGSRERSTPTKDWPAALALLSKEFPNFAEVIDQAIRPHLALLAAGATRSRMAPLLLVGPPGVGKTVFARRVSGILGTSETQVDIAASTNGSELAGSSIFWSNSAPGMVLTALGWGAAGQRAFADPLLIVDEVDKVSADRYDPLGALYSLLEKASAQRFEDQSIPGLPMNASLIRWVLTANDAERIPAPIRSRTLQFDIRSPTAGELEQIAKRSMLRLVHELDIEFDAVLPVEVTRKAALLSPREISQRLEVAIGNALMQGRRQVKAADWIDPASSATHSHRRVGFV